MSAPPTTWRSISCPTGGPGASGRRGVFLPWVDHAYKPSCAGRPAWGTTHPNPSPAAREMREGKDKAGSPFAHGLSGSPCFLRFPVTGSCRARRSCGWLFSEPRFADLQRHGNEKLAPAYPGLVPVRHIFPKNTKGKQGAAVRLRGILAGQNERGRRRHCDTGLWHCRRLNRPLPPEDL